MFLYAAFFFQPTAGNSAGLRPENLLIGSLLSVVSDCPGSSRESFSGTADGLVEIRDDPRELIPDDWCMGCFPLGEELGVLPGLLL